MTKRHILETVIRASLLPIGRVMFGHSALDFFDRRHFFIVGCGHSGTSLLIALLDNHSRLCAIPGESRCFTAPWFLRFPKYLGWMRAVDRAGVSLFIEKTPLHVHEIAKIKAQFSNSRILGITRDPLDTCSSLMRRGSSLNESVARWNKDNTALLEAKGSGEIALLLRYEDLVVQPESELRSILDLVDLTLSPDLLDLVGTPKRWYSKTINRPYDYNARTHRQFRNWQINQPIFDGRGRWRESIDAETAQHIEERTRILAAVFGYAPDRLTQLLEE